MVGITEEEKNCNNCNQPGMCDGPQYMGGFCSCSCHTEGDKRFKYVEGRIEKR